MGGGASLQMLGRASCDVTAPSLAPVAPETARVMAKDLHASEVPCLILATCHRFEVYWWGDALQAARVRAVVTAHAGHAVSALGEQRSGDDALMHLMAVAAGMRSMRRGEPEILGQTRHAWQVAQWDGTSCSALDAHVRAAIAAARHLRRSFASQPAASIGDATAELILHALRAGALPAATSEARRILLLGAGAVGHSVARAIARSVREQRDGDTVSVLLEIANRTDTRSRLLAEETGAAMVSWHDWPDRLIDADVVVCAARSAHPLLLAEDAQRVTSRRRESVLWIDLASPPNIAADVDHPRIDRRTERDLPGAGVDAAMAPLIERALRQELERFRASCARRDAWTSARESFVSTSAAGVFVSRAGERRATA